MYGYQKVVLSGMPGGTVAAVRLLEMKSDGHLATQCRVNWLPRFPCAPLPPKIQQTKMLVKGQLISKCLLGVIVSTKKPTNFF